MPRVFTVTMSDGPVAAAFAALDDAQRERAIGLGLPLLDAALTAVEGVADGAWGKRVEAERERADVAERAAEARVAAVLETQACVLRDARQAAAADRASALEDANRRLEQSQRELEAAREHTFTRAAEAASRVRAECEARTAAVEERERVLLGALQASSVRGAKSTTRGVDGEALACDMLHQLFPSAEIADCRNVAGAGDFVVLEGDMNMMVEVKNYTRNVARTEIDKFKRDMLANPTYTCGVLASMRSGVCGKEDFSVEVLGDRPVVYVHRLEDDPGRMRQAANVFRMLHSVENADLRQQGVLDAIATELQERRCRYQQLRQLADRHAASLVAWAEQDEARSSAVLRRALGAQGS